MTIILDGTTGITTPTVNSSGDLTIADKIIHAGDTNTAIRFPAADTVTVETNGVERVRIDASGNLLVGTTSGGSGRIVSVGRADGAIYTFDSNQSPFGSGAIGHIRFSNSNGTVGTITTNGSSTAFNTFSDYRLKDNVAPMQNALDTVAQLNPVTYTWKADGSTGQGFIAHELQAVVPDCVTGEKDAVDSEGNPQYQGVDTSFLVATLVKAIQELTARVAELEAAQ